MASWRDNSFTRKLGVSLPLVQAPMGGGPTTPSLVSAVCEAGGLGSIAAQITENFVASSEIVKSALILLGLILFATTLGINIIARLIVQRSQVDHG